MESKHLIIILVLISILAIYARYDYETGGTMTGKYVPISPGYTHEQIEQREAEGATGHDEYGAPIDGTTAEEGATPADTGQIETGGADEASSGEEATLPQPFNIGDLFGQYGVVIALVVAGILYLLYRFAIPK